MSATRDWSGYAPRAPDLRLIAILAKLGRRHKKRYAYPSRDYLQRCLKLEHQRPMCLRTIGYHLRALEAAGWFSRQKRHHAGPDGMEFRTTLYKFRAKLIAFVRSMSGVVRRALTRSSGSAPAPGAVAPPRPTGQAPPRSQPPPEFRAAVQRLNRELRRKK
ncbi:MAG: hypothetical protein ACYCUI_11550 [Vulcanimicrobiaceae bacterium]